MTDSRAAVLECLGAALRIAPDEINMGASLVDGLGVDSMELLNIFFRLEKRMGIKLRLADLIEYLRGDLPTDQFLDDNGCVTAAGVQRLKQVLPHTQPQVGMNMGMAFAFLRVADLICFIDWMRVR